MSAEQRPWSVYMLRCADGTLYTGATNDMSRRLRAHGCGKGAAYTRCRLPVELVFSEQVGTRSAALKREAALKRLSRREKLLLLPGSGAPGVTRNRRGNPSGRKERVAKRARR